MDGDLLSEVRDSFGSSMLSVIPNEQSKTKENELSSEEDRSEILDNED